MKKHFLFYRNFGMNVIPCNHKVAMLQWGKYGTELQDDSAELLGWDVNSIAGISGVNDFAVLDFDKANIFNAERMLLELGLPADYGWLVRSGSGNGFHIWFRLDRRKMGDDSIFKSSGVIQLHPKEEGLCHHAEVRLENCYTILPPSAHLSGINYSFVNGEPEYAPTYIPEKHLLVFIAEFFSHRPVLKKNPKKNKSEKPAEKLSGYTAAKLESAAKYLADHLGANCYANWNRMGLALCSLGGEGLPYFLKLSRNPNYQQDDEKNEKVFYQLLANYNGSISIGSVFYLAKELGWEPPFYPFWKRAKGRVIFDKNNFINFLTDRNFSKVLYNSYYEFIFIEDSFIKFVQPFFIKDYVTDYIRSLPDSYFTNDKGLTAEKILHHLIENFRLFTNATLEFLPSVELKTVKDTEKESYIFFKNCFVKVTAEGPEAKDYSELEGNVFADRVIKKDFRLSKRISEFEKFCFNICDQRIDRFNSLRSAIGFLLHGYKDPSNARAVIFCDEVIGNGAAGRSGKSLIAHAIGKLRMAADLPGRNFNFNDRFAFQIVTPATEIIIFNDVDKNFRFEKLFNNITDDFTVERKNKNQFIIRFRDSPKILITTNFSIKDSDISAIARQFVLEFSSHYNIKHTPIDEFKHRFFDDWDDDEWQSFFTFMANCLAYFLKNGLQEYDYINLPKRKIIEACSEEFYDYTEEHLKPDIFIEKNKFFEKFKEAEPGSSELKSQTFTRWLRHYANAKGLNYYERRLKFPQVRCFAITNLTNIKELEAENGSL